MQRDYKIYVKDILKAIDNILKYTKYMGNEKFHKNKLVQDAVVRNFEIIGEAVKNIPEEIKEKYKQIEWKEIAGLRDILIHKYFEINLFLLWDIIKNKLPGLKNSISLMLQEDQ